MDPEPSRQQSPSCGNTGTPWWPPRSRAPLNPRWGPLTVVAA